MSEEIQFGTLTDNGITNVRVLRNSDIKKCPFVIFLPEHYNDDGSCKCHDPKHREMMKKEWGYTDKSFQEAGII